MFAWLILLLAKTAEAHPGAVPIRGVYDWSDLPDAEPGAWNVWEFYPSIVIGIALMIATYVFMAGPGRRRWNLSDIGPTRGDWTSFMLSMFVLFFSLQGPLHELSDVYLFSGHMVQHLLITLVFPPLLIRGIPPWMWKPVVSVGWIAAVGRFLTQPLMAFAIGTGTLYLWHVPAMYEWAMANHDVHIIEHLSFMVSAVVMWWPAYSRIPEIPKLTPGMLMVYLFLCTIPMKGLGAIITVSDYILYPFYSVQPRMFGMDPMFDQRLGGLIMWIPGGLVFWVTIGVIFFRHFYKDVVYARSGKPKSPSKQPVVAT